MMGTAIDTRMKTSKDSLWTRTSDVPIYPIMRDDVHADVCIVGGGIAGLSSGYLLAKEGYSVVIVDSGPIANGESSLTTAHLSNAVDDTYIEIERLHGSQGARLVAQSHTMAINRIEEIVQNERIECNFDRVDGYLFQPPEGASQFIEGFLEQELAAAHRAGLPEVVLIDHAPLTSFDTGPCLRFPNQAQFHPLKYLAGLARAIERDGGQIYSNSRVAQVRGGSHARVVADNGHTVTCGAIIVATNTPMNTRITMHTKQTPYTTYVIGALVPPATLPKCLLWDTQTPYHYVRIEPDVEGVHHGNAHTQHDLLIVGGEDHKTGRADDIAERYERLARWAGERFPIQSIEFQWAGQIFEPVDGVAFIGRTPMEYDNVYIATGDSGMGMTHGTIAGILLTDLIAGRDHEWKNLYDPARKSLRAIGTYVKEGVDMASQYLDWCTPSDVADVSEIPAGEGAVVRRGATKVAIYRDSAGTLHEFSAICPHLGCIVGWNSTESTWDCPCHGSRFDKLGQVIHGPANRNLTGLRQTDKDA